MMSSSTTTTTATTGSSNLLEDETMTGKKRRILNKLDCLHKFDFFRIRQSKEFSHIKFIIC